MTIGEKIRMLRKENKMTLEDVAKQLKIGRSTVLRYEDGTVTNIPSDKVAMMAKLFNVSPAFLIGWTEDANEEPRHVVIQNMSQFAHLMQYMSEEDYNYVIAAFDRASAIMKEKGIEP